LKKVVAVFLAFLIFYNVIGYFVVFKSCQLAIRKEIKQKIKNSVPENELIIIKFSTKDIANGNKGYKKINDHEFRLFGKLYDVVRKKTSGDTSILYCINDIKEEQLFSNLDSHVKSTMESNAPLRQKTNTLFKLIIQHAILLKNPSISIHESSYEFSNMFLEKLIPIYKNVLTPPPENII
jgi:hypothetical protein